MNQFLRNLTPTQQVATLFLVVFGLLVIVSIGAFLMSLQMQKGPHDDARAAEMEDFRKLLSTSWLMVIVFWLAWATGEMMATILFALIGFFALREFITLSPTR